MSDDDKDDGLVIMISEEAAAQLELDPEKAEAMRHIMAAFHQAFDGVKRGQYKTMDDAMEAILGSRPQKVDVATGEAIPGSSMHHDMGLDDDDEEDA